MKKLILSSLILLSIFYACEDSETGCLDVLSSNFGFNAVSACDSCCTYPTVQSNFRIYYDSLSVKLITDTLFFNIEDTLIVHDIELLTSNYTFNGVNGTYRIRDSISVNGVDVKDDFMYFDNLSSYNIGDIRFEDSISGINFNLGISENDLIGYKPYNSIHQESNLDDALDSMYNESIDKVAFLKLDIQLGDSIREIELYDSPERLEFIYETNVIRGFAWTYTTRLELNELLKGVTPENTNEEIISAFKDNIESSITID